jgi:hypothetical protein
MWVYLLEGVLFAVGFALYFEDLTEGALAELRDHLEIFES